MCKTKSLLVLIAGVLTAPFLIVMVLNMSYESTFQPMTSAGKNQEPSMIDRMVLIKGGSFLMGNVFGDGAKNEQPVHKVTLDDYFLAKTEVTVADFRTFVKETEYKTSAEAPENREAQQKIIEIFMDKTKREKLSPEEIKKLNEEFLTYSGSSRWRTDAPVFDYCHDLNWRNPYFDQTDEDPVIALSAVDAINYCNWLSGKEGLPVAYDLKTHEMLDEKGKPTLDTTKVRGYRLPTEAEWEYAARERGKKVRFGNGKNTARSEEINFKADSGDYPYMEKGDYRCKTVPVGSFEPNSLFLYNMSGNAWEWCSDSYSAYDESDQTNPYFSKGDMKVIRGGRWGSEAATTSVFARFCYASNNRCNNSGFRIARSK